MRGAKYYKPKAKRAHARFYKVIGIMIPDRIVRLLGCG